MDEEKKKKRRKTLLIILFVIFNAAVIIITAVSEFSKGENAAELSEIRLQWYFLIPAAACWLAAVLAECYKYGLIMKKECGFVNKKLCVETVLLGRYYDNITPSGVGGQPFQIYYMKKGGLSNADSAAIPLVGFVSMQFGFIILALFMFIFGAGLVQSDFIRITSYFGLVMYAIFPVLILMFSFCENTTRRFLNWIIHILHKMKLVKDPYATSLSWSSNLSEYAVAIRRITKNWKLCLEVMGLSFIYQIGIISIPFFVILTFGGNVDFISCFITTLAIYATITFIPTPGNAGVAEGSFYAVFTSLTSGYIFWAMLTWRFFVFYLFIIIGLLIYLKYFIVNRKKKYTNSIGHTINNMTGNKPIKIALSVDIFYPSIDGVVKVVDNYADTLNTYDNVECSVFAPVIKPFYVDTKPYGIIRLPGILFVKGVALTVPFLSSKPKKYFNEFKPDIVHSHSPFTVGNYLYKLAKKNNIPYVMTLHSKYRDDFKRLFKFDFLADLALKIIMKPYHKADYVWTVSRGASDILREYGYKGDILVMENGIDFDPPEDLEPIKALAAEKYNINPNEKILIFVGRISAQKNIYLLLDAFKLIANEGYRLILVGVQEEMVAVKSYAMANGIMSHITFTGVIESQDELMGLYALSDLFFFPSTYDTFALVVHEAASVSVPSLVIEGTCPAANIEDGVNGYICSLDAESAASKIKEIFADEEGRLRAGINAKKTLFKNWNQVMPDVLDEYKKIISDYRAKH